MPSGFPFRSRMLFNTPADLTQFDATPFETGDHATVLQLASPSLLLDRRVGFTLVREDSTSIVDNVNTIAVGPNGLGEGRWRRASAHLNTFKKVVTLDATPVDLNMGIMAPSESLLTVIEVTAHDDSGQQTAFVLNGVPFARFGNGPILVNGVPLPMPAGLQFAPNVAPWNTITADLTQGPNFELFITVAGLPGVEIAWIANVEYRTIEVGQ